MKNNIRNTSYGTRILAEGVSVTEDTRISGRNNNVCCIGSSGCGKSGGYVVPNLQTLENSIILQDTKGKLCDLLGDDLKKRGFNVINLDFENPNNSYGYNPLDAVRLHEDGSVYEQDIMQIANVLSPKLNSDDPFWEMSSAAMIRFLIAFTLEALPEDEHNMMSVVDLFHTFVQPNGHTGFLPWINEHPHSMSAHAFAEVQTSRPADRTFACIASFAAANLASFTVKEVANIFAGENSINIADIGRRKTAVFVKVSDTDQTFKDVVSLFFTQAINTLCREADKNPEGRLDVPVHFILDDFASGTYIPNFDQIISVIRSRDIWTSIIIQSMSQLNTMYSAYAADTIINNCDTILYLAANDVGTAKYVAKRAFKTTDNILTMPRDKAYVLFSGEKALLANKIKPYSTLHTDEPEPESYENELSDSKDPSVQS
jgi:type IV secretion system protein VirD4